MLMVTLQLSKNWGLKLNIPRYEKFSFVSIFIWRRHGGTRQRDAWYLYPRRTRFRYTWSIVILTCDVFKLITDTLISMRYNNISYLRVYPWALTLYHPETLLYSLRRRRRLYSGVEEKTGGPRENHRLVASHWQTLSYNVVHLALIEIRAHNISGVRHWLHM